MNPYETRKITRRFQQEPNGMTSPSKREDVPANEISWSESDVIQSISLLGGNIDPVVRSKGLEIYREMMEDDQVKACVELRKQARLSTPWTVVSAEDGNSQADMLADFVNHNIERMAGTFEDDLYNIYSAIEYGYSISEIVYEMLDDGPFAGRIGIRAIKTREPYRYDFQIDPHGNLLGIVYSGQVPQRPSIIGDPNRLLLGPARSPMTGINESFPPEKFVIYSYNSQFGNWYGRSDLLSAFRSWQIKRHVMKFWNVWLERYASPFVWATYERGMGVKAQAMKELDDFLKNLSARSAIRVSDAIKLNAFEASTAAGNAYEQAIEAHNRFISHAILCPNLMGFTGSQGSGNTGGTYALGKKHFDAFVWVLQKMGRDTSETIMREQIIKRLISINFPNVEDDLIPKFKFEGIEEESIEARSRIVTMLANAGFLSQEEPWLREFLTLPKKDPDIVLPPSAKELGVEGGGKEDNDDEKNDNKDDGREKSMRLIAEAKKVSEARRKFFAKREPSRFEKKIRVKEFIHEFERADKELFLELTEEIEGIRDKILAQVDKKGIIAEGDPKAVDSIAVNVGGVKETLRAWLAKVFLDSKLRAFEELGRAGMKIEVVRKFADASAPFEPWNPLPPKEAIDFFNRKVLAYIISEEGKRKLIEIATGSDLKYFDSRAFAIAGIVRDDILNGAKSILLNAIKRQDVAGGTKDLKDMFNRYLQQGVEVDEELLKPSRLNTIVRTNITEAVNEGRRAMYEDTDVAGFVQFWEYSAIMDERTTDYCECMNGKTFRIEDLPALNPPAHFNCRSVSVPITKFEVQELNDEEERGVEVSEPCFDRADGFTDIKREVVKVIEPEAVQTPASEAIPIPKVAPKKPEAEVKDIPAAKKSAADIAAEQRLREELTMIIARCPYSSCGSDKIRMTGSRMNVGEFYCDSCELPFRVSNKGDAYLYDAGLDRWERVSMGINPRYFKEKK